MNQPLQASRRSTLAIGISAILILILAFWGWHHIETSVVILQTQQGPRFALIYAVAFLLLFWQTILCAFDRPFRARAGDWLRLSGLRITVVVPVYNEDPAYLRECLTSLLCQTRPPQAIHIVDDGSTENYDSIREDFQADVRKQSVEQNISISLVWHRTVNQGKRHAQSVAFQAAADTTDVFVTVDSDGILAPNAIAELLKPFADSEILSVAGVVLAENNQRSFISRMTDLWFVTGQLVDRSAASVFGSVLVNSGVLAAYRTPLIMDNLHAYLNETFFGRHVEFSDDSMLTLFALQHGKTVQQSSAFAFTAMPETLSHHLRQYVRWMRGAFIRSWGRFRYLPLNRYAYWAHFLGWAQMAMTTVVFLSLFVIGPAVTLRWSPWLLFIPMMIAYGQGLRYLTVRRTDERLRSQLLTFALAPIAFLWAFFVLRLVRWYAICTCLKTGWGTRADGAELALNR